MDFEQNLLCEPAFHIPEAASPDCAPVPTRRPIAATRWKRPLGFGACEVIQSDRLAPGPSALPAPGIDDDEERMLLIFQMSGECEIRHACRAVVIEAGQWTLCRDTAFRLGNPTRNAEQLIVRFPRTSVECGRNLDRLLVDRPSEAGSVGRLILQCAHMAQFPERQISARGREELADIILRIVQLALLEHEGTRAMVAMRETLRDRIKAYIVANIRDPDLSIDKIARHFSCSKRNLHKVFRDEGSTLNKFLWSIRLERCRDALRDESLCNRSITEIAYMWGFNNSSHFSRVFRAQFGISPREFRSRSVARCAPDRTAGALAECAH